MAVTILDSAITPVAGAASGAAQSNAASLAATAAKTNFLEGFDITGGGATAASVIEVSVTGLAAGTLKYELNILAGVTGPMNAQGGFSVRFPQPLPASGVNTAITVTVPSLGAGNTNAAVVAYGFQK
jgi:hypothetical protein